MLNSSQINQLKKIRDPLIRKQYLVYFQLPQELRRLFFAEETANKIRIIAKKNNLNDKQLWWTSHITGKILLGEINIINFVKTLQEKCGLAEEPARKLARDINQTIFLPVKESLKKIHKVSKWPREDEALSPEPTGPRLEGNVVDLKGEK